MAIVIRRSRWIDARRPPGRGGFLCALPALLSLLVSTQPGLSQSPGSPGPHAPATQVNRAAEVEDIAAKGESGVSSEHEGDPPVESIADHDPTTDPNPDNAGGTALESASDSGPPTSSMDATSAPTRADTSAVQMLPPRTGRSRSPTNVQTAAPREAVPPSPSVGSLWQGLWPLVVVLGLVGAGAYALRRWVPGRVAAESRCVRVVGRSSLGVRQQAVLLHVGRRLVLVGLAGDRMATLCEISDADEVATLLAQSSSPPAHEGSIFEQLFTRERRGFDDAASENVEPPDIDHRHHRESRPMAELLRRLRSMSSA
ncbi:MAG: flagellar biosynthetic protein FliO [Phycisphaerae bacterium]|nr:flagellar biosynthetic protein FliO [Phycisphaerae bacterium]